MSKPPVIEKATPALVGNAADESQVGNAKKRELTDRQREVLDTQVVLGTEAGRRFVWKYLEECGVFRSCYSQNPLDMALLEGERNVGLKLLRNVEAADQNALLVMMQEAKKRESNNYGQRTSKEGTGNASDSTAGD